MDGGQDDLALRIFPGGDPLFLCLLDAVVHRIADNVHDRVADVVNDRLVKLCIFPDQGQTHVFVQSFSHVPDDPVHLLEDAGDRNHPQGHGDILQIIRQLAELSG